MRSQSSRPNLNLATWPFGLENGEYYIRTHFGQLFCLNLLQI
jgi:hypothetical protein